MRYFISIAGAVGLLIAGAFTPLYAEGPDQAALAGLSDVKIAFDMRNGDAKGLLRELDVIDETLRRLGVPAAETEEYLTRTLLALRGWAGMIWQMETNAEWAVHPAPRGSLIGRLAPIAAVR